VALGSVGVAVVGVVAGGDAGGSWGGISSRVWRHRDGE